MQIPSLLVFSAIYLMIGLQLFVARSLLQKATTLWQLSLFALIQSLTVLILSWIMPVIGIQYVLHCLIHMIYQMWIFDAPLFPDALFSSIAPLTLGAVGELLYRPLTRMASLTKFPVILQTALNTPFKWTAFLPGLAIAFCFFLKPCPANNRGSATADNAILRQLTLFVPIIALHNIIIILFIKPEFAGSFFLDKFFYAGFLLLPVIFFTLCRYMNHAKHDKKIINYQLQKNRLQESAIRALREERHDYLNELTLISTYAQLEKWDEALSCLEYAAASLSDRYNYATLPEDAWLTVLSFKQQEAEARGIDFEILNLAEKPTNFNELRLLPKLVMNLIDNSFTAASKAARPKVQLVWAEQYNGTRILRISNNGPPIPSTLGQRIFFGGISSKENNNGNNGWGLVICQKIASELGGTLSYESNEKKTTFTLSLPPPLLCDNQVAT